MPGISDSTQEQWVSRLLISLSSSICTVYTIELTARLVLGPGLSGADTLFLRRPNEADRVQPTGGQISC
jgi:hypothetical protein